MIKQVTDEIKLHSTLNHPNIVKFYSLLEDIDNLYLILEYV
jgi:serine/threonine protein kinase